MLVLISFQTNLEKLLKSHHQRSKESKSDSAPNPVYNQILESGTALGPDKLLVFRMELMSYIGCFEMLWHVFESCHSLIITMIELRVEGCWRHDVMMWLANCSIAPH